jgi:hypothetical protein
MGFLDCRKNPAPDAKEPRVPVFVAVDHLDKSDAEGKRDQKVD